MKTVLVTGSSGFLGRNLCTALARRGDVEIVPIDSSHAREDLAAGVARADFLFHLAGVNRPRDESEFTKQNVGFTEQICAQIEARDRPLPLVFSSSIQAEFDNPYGRSKRAAEEVLLALGRATDTPVYVHRLPNVFGKWSRPEYNSVVATFCHHLSRGRPVRVDEPSRPLRLAYVDDVVHRWLDLLDHADSVSSGRHDHEPVHEITVGRLHDRIVSFRDSRASGLLPDLSDPLTRALYATYVSFLDPGDLATPVDLKTDPRGWLFELVKSRAAGQIFISRTRPGVTRGNHYHDTKVEKFCVIQGEGVIRFRPIAGDSVVEYPVSDGGIRIVDIPPGLTHSIENTGDDDMITIFWASEIFDPHRPDTHAAAVLPES